MSLQIVLLSGKQGSGKSTVQEALRNLAPKHGFDAVFAYNFADALYRLHDVVLDTLENTYGIKRTTKKDGVLLQLLGTEWGRKVYGPNIWVNIVRKLVETVATLPGKNLVVIADCRFKNEFDGFPEAVRARLEASEECRRTRTNSWRDNTAHPSEVDLDDYATQDRFDFVFETSEDAKQPPEFIAQVVLNRLDEIEVLP